MKYGFEIRMPLNEVDNTALGDESINLVATGSLILKAQVAVDTELPDAMVETLRQRVSSLLSSKIGEVEAALTSIEH